VTTVLVAPALAAMTVLVAPAVAVTTVLVAPALAATGEPAVAWVQMFLLAVAWVQLDEPVAGEAR